jgi:hypothetical protein
MDPVNGGIFVGHEIGLAQVVTPSNVVDIPLDYIGNPEINLYAPAQFRTALDQKTGLPLVGANGGNLLVALWEMPVAPAGMSYAASPITASIAAGAIASASPVLTTAGFPAATFSVSPALPAGLSLNAATGAISGTPTAVTASALYTITALNGGGSTTATVTIEVTA